MKTTLPRTAIAIAMALLSMFDSYAADVVPQVVIVGTTPLPGIGQASEEVAAPVQGATAGDMRRSGALDLSDFLNRRMGSVHVNEVQGNPFQMDVSYRGYTASPLLRMSTACA
jgi:outer membrane receptor for ferrienterochelin and colicin